LQAAVPERRERSHRSGAGGALMRRRRRKLYPLADISVLIVQTYESLSALGSVTASENDNTPMVPQSFTVSKAGRAEGAPVRSDAM
jgi:hypothetical protein